MPSKKRIFYSICLISFTGSFLSTALNIAIPSMAADFGVMPDKLTWVVTVFLIASAAFLLPFGKISDIYGRRRTYMTALAGFGISTLLAAFAPVLPLLLVLRIIQGMFLAAIYVSYMPLLLTTTDETCQGRILGITVSLTYLGLSLGPVLGGILSQFAGWRCIFVVPALLTFAAHYMMRPVHEEWYAKGAPFVNIVSSALSVSGIVFFLWGLSSYETNRFFLWLGLILLVLFVFHESRSYHPLLPLFIFRNITFSMSNLAALIQYSATYAISFLLSLYLQVILGISPAVMGYGKKTTNRNPGGQMRKKKSEYATQLNEKQKVKFVYGILENQFHTYYEKASRMPGQTGVNLLVLVERRLDNVVYRLGFAKTRRDARQLVSHNHFTVNGKRVNIPSYQVIESSRSSVKFSKLLGEEAPVVLLPSWLERDKNALKGTVTKLPVREDIDVPIAEHLIVELYSK